MPTEIKQASVQDTHKALNENKSSVMIDVREDDEIKALAPSIGRAFPMSRINPATFAEDCGISKTQAIYLFCRSGNRSMRVGMALANAGFTDLTNVEGGIIAWDAAGLPVKKG